jgi:protein-S-isoprenylcysteine O-methyltransferase Ste14
MKSSTIIILSHQIVFQGLFIAKNILLRQKLGIAVRGRNQEANLSIVFFCLYITVSFLFSLDNVSFGTVSLISKTVATVAAIILLAVNLLIGTASLIGLKDSWRVGILEDQQTDLIEGGIYRFSRNPYFLSYLIMLVAYTVLLQNIVLLIFSVLGFVIIHRMVLKEEQHLTKQHGDIYCQYLKKVPRYFIICIF